MEKITEVADKPVVQASSSKSDGKSRDRVWRLCSGRPRTEPDVNQACKRRAARLCPSRRLLPPSRGQPSTLQPCFPWMPAALAMARMPARIALGRVGLLPGCSAVHIVHVSPAQRKRPPSSMAPLSLLRFPVGHAACFRRRPHNTATPIAAHAKTLAAELGSSSGTELSSSITP